jgi:hypothetical protein
MESNICQQHNLGFVKYCCNEACKKFLCETCFVDHSKLQHQILSKEDFLNKARANVALYQNTLQDWKNLEEKLKEKEVSQTESVQKLKDVYTKDLKAFTEFIQTKLDGIDKEMNALNIGHKVVHQKVQEAQALFEQKRKESEEKVKNLEENQWVLLNEEKRDDDEKIKEVVKQIEQLSLSNLQSLSQESANQDNYALKTFMQGKIGESEKELSLQAKLSIIFNFHM